MRSRGWFALGVRLLGVWVLYRAVGDLLHLGTAVLGINPETVAKQWDSAHTGVMYELWYVAGFGAFAIYLLLGAEHLTRWVYGEPPVAAEMLDSSM
jgi:hypothetical protein